LNTFPTDASRIEANVASGTYVIGAVVNADAVGFPALDYLLHGASDAEILAAFAQDSRKDYLRDNLSFIQTAVSQTASNWENGYQENFLSASNAGTDTGSSLGMVINAMTLHYERFLRDGKIGIPAGVRSAGVPRPTLVESVYGGYSVDLAVANLEAFKRLFLGNTLAGAEGVGLDDNLEALDAAPLAESIVAEIDEAIAAVQNLTDPLDQQIQADNQLAITAFQQMQDVVALVKSDMTSVLGVTITFRDIDGD
ncbi:MAG: imelysin family protein, partial [Bacteroidota bacterium]